MDGRVMARKSDTGEPTDYTIDEEEELYESFEEAFEEVFEDEEDEEAGSTPTTMRVTAQVEWSGVLDRARDGVRTVNLDGLDLTRVRTALTAAQKASSRAESAGKGLRATSWEDQLVTLVKSRYGHAATDRAGLTVTPDTLRRWLAGDRDPTPANQAKIATAYRDVRDQVAAHARTRAERARHDLADQVSAALAERYGAEIRLRRITRLDLG